MILLTVDFVDDIFNDKVFLFHWNIPPDKTSSILLINFYSVYIIPDKLKLV